MKSMRPPLAAIFFMTYFHRAGGHDPLAPPDPLLATQAAPSEKIQIYISAVLLPMNRLKYKKWLLVKLSKM